MSKIFKIEVDCANCANLVEDAARKVAGVKDLSISFITQKMKVTFDDDVDKEKVMAEVIKVAKKSRARLRDSLKRIIWWWPGLRRSGCFLNPIQGI